MSVRIYQLDKAFTQWIWLCDDHLARRKALKFIEKERKDPPHDGLTCTDCHFGEPTTIPPTETGASDANR